MVTSKMHKVKNFITKHYRHPVAISDTGSTFFKMIFSKLEK